MPLRDPVAVYNAVSNLDAHLVVQALASADIEGFVIEDMSRAGAWIGGLVAEIHKPQVFVERADIPRARPVLEAYERTAEERKAAREREISVEPPIDVTCEDCGKTSRFSAALRGTVDQCQHCGAYVDVEGDDIAP